MPVEPSVTVWVPAPVPMDRLPEAAAVEVGLKRTVTEQVPLTASELLQSVETKLYAAPDTAAEDGTVTDSGPRPVLDRVATAVLLEPTAVAGNDGVDSVADCPTPEPVMLI